jgi:hypothetical protein
MLLLGEHGTLLLSPIAPRRWRVAGDRGPLHGSLRPAAPDAEALQALCDPYLPRPARITRVHRSTCSCTHHRRAASFRRGRAFLLGGAARVPSPLTFEGTNAGIQDAWNLGWKLACAERGAATDGLLASYDAERRGIDLRITRDRAEIERNLPLRGSLGRPVRDAVFPFVAARPGYERAIARTTTQLSYGYRGSPAVAGGRPGHPRPGDLAPERPLTTDGGVAIHDGRAYVALRFVGTGAELDSFVPVAWPTNGSVRVRTVAVCRHLGDDARGPRGVAVVHDADGGLHEAWGASGPTQVLVRPDGYLAWRGRAEDTPDLARHLARVHGGPIVPAVRAAEGPPTPAPAPAPAAPLRSSGTPA